MKPERTIAEEILHVAANLGRRRAIELIAGEVPATLSLWKRTKEDHPAQAQGDAVDVLSQWAHLQRFPSEALPPCAATLTCVVAEDAQLLAEMALEDLEGRPAYWLWQATGHANYYVEYSRSATVDEDIKAGLRSEGLSLFIALDRLDLAAWAINQVWLPENPADTRLSGILGRLGACHAWLEENASLFQGAACYAYGLLQGYDIEALETRDDSDGAAKALAVTTDKYKAVAALCKQ